MVSRRIVFPNNIAIITLSNTSVVTQISINWGNTSVVTKVLPLSAIVIAHAGKSTMHTPL
jgi:hypothetical protein